jgi:hypothetical protein
MNLADPSSLLKALRANDRVRIVDNDRTILRHTTVYDISLSGARDDDDRVISPLVNLGVLAGLVPL